MSITDELREYAGSFYLFRYKDVREKLDAIADRIDEELQKVTRDLNNLAEASVLLPVDADGVRIHVGDVLDGYGKECEVWALTFGGNGIWSLSDSLGDTYYDMASFSHHHEPTVENMLWELLGDIRPGMEDEEAVPIVKAYAEKLRLADDGEE